MNEEMALRAMIAFAKAKNPQYIPSTHCYTIQSQNLYHAFVSFRGIMMKYMWFALVLGASVSAMLLYARRRDLAGTEFNGFFDSSTVADDLFGDAFDELPDKP